MILSVNNDLNLTKNSSFFNKNNILHVYWHQFVYYYAYKASTSYRKSQRQANELKTRA